MSAAVFRETAAEPRTQSVPLAHVSLELGHLYMEDFEAGPERLREHFARVRPWADAVRASAAVGGRQPRISTCFLIDDYFTRFSSPAELVPTLLAEAEKAGLTIDYLARESGCAVADGIGVAEAVEHRLVESPPTGSDGSRPPAGETGWLANGERGPDAGTLEAMAQVPSWRPPAETAARRHSVFVDVELWDNRNDRRTWSCPFLAAVWQLARLGLLRHHGEPVLRPRPWSGGAFPSQWDDLPSLVQLNATAAPFSAYRTASVLPSRFLPVEHAVRVILDQVDADPGALRQVAERSAREGMAVPDEIADRASYVFYAGP
ncbi:SCO2522 family protein [Streptomyces sp. NBC_01142]|uniref:SCO2522 family protein n=1 Tax=Streptomyces sp. NBC_01142 TaxID=2975865 RepID=UPI00225291B6|nr:SCO2522 family protein [Streptomyces sp. NBC_01142]MCX4821415.1 SCO2522 family protein [Streptomyces sp. NBC_01142]